MIRRRLVAILLVLLSATAATVAMAEAPRLRFDPFVHPDLSARNPTSTASGVPELLPIHGLSPVLNATMVDGKSSMANLGGVVLGIGEESQGYRLVEVRRFEAVFEKNGNKIVIAVGKPEGS